MASLLGLKFRLNIISGNVQCQGASSSVTHKTGALMSRKQSIRQCHGVACHTPTKFQQLSVNVDFKSSVSHDFDTNPIK